MGNLLIQLKSGKVINIDNITEVIVRKKLDNSHSFTDVSKICLFPEHTYTFVGEKESITILSDEISYLNFFKN